MMFLQHSVVLKSQAVTKKKDVQLFTLNLTILFETYTHCGSSWLYCEISFSHKEKRRTVKANPPLGKKW